MAEKQNPVDDDEANEILSSIRKLVSKETGGPSSAPPEFPRRPAAAPFERPEPPLSSGTVPPGAAPEPAAGPGVAGRGPELVQTPVLETEDEEIVPLFDEEELRALVSEIVKEELQGELGERITRNIRSLVRKEVQRAIDEGFG